MLECGEGWTLMYKNIYSELLCFQDIRFWFDSGNKLIIERANSSLQQVTKSYMFVIKL